MGFGIQIDEQIQRVSHENQLMGQSSRYVTESFAVAVGIGFVLTLAASGCRESQTEAPLTRKKIPAEVVLTSNKSQDEASPVANAISKSTNPRLEQAYSKAPKIAAHPRLGEFTKSQFTKKEHTLVLIGLDSTARHNFFFENAKLEPYQFDALRQLVDSYDDDYKRLRLQRDRILNYALDGQDVQLQLNNVNVEILLTSRKISRSIYRNIMTEAQKAAAAERGKNTRAKLVVGKKKKQ